MKKLLFIAAVCGLAASAGAQSAQQAASNLSQRLEATEREYSQLMETIEREKLPLARRLTELEAQVIQARQEFTEQRRLVEGSDASLINLQSQVNGLSDNINYITNLLADYINRFETMTHLGERSLYEKEVREATEARENSELTAGQRFEEQLDVINAALGRLQSVIGGHRFEGAALTPASAGGARVPGTYVLLGPVAYFAPSGQATAGLATVQASAISPAIYNLPSANGDQAVRQLASEGRADILYGPPQAVTYTEADITLAQEWAAGGLVMWPILILTGLAFMVAIYKWVELARIKAARQRDLDVILEHLGNGRQDEALAHARRVGGPVGEMLQAAVENAYEDREVIEEVLYEKIISTQPRLERLLPFIAVVAATAPLLGLLGTVTGMIETFKLITIVGTGDARSLSSGISEALITTKWGLISAIPALILHALLSRKARGVVGSMEQTAVGFINGVTEMRDRNSTQTA